MSEGPRQGKRTSCYFYRQWWTIRKQRWRFQLQRNFRLVRGYRRSL